MNEVLAFELRDLTEPEKKLDLNQIAINLGEIRLKEKLSHAMLETYLLLTDVHCINLDSEVASMASFQSPDSSELRKCFHSWSNQLHS
jgi:hypothetical protein